MTAPLTAGSLCSGFGGLEIGLELALGPVRHAWHAEVETDASTVLAANWSGVPNLGDITAVDWDQVPRVDIVCAGYPCQPFSSNGRRKGEQDDRNRWPDVARAIRGLRPRLVVLENVREHIRIGFGRVVADLAALGYVGSWQCLRASDAGAAHRRERVIVVAWPATAGGPGIRVASPAGEPAVRGLDLLPTPVSTLGRGTGMPSAALAANRFMSGRRCLDDAIALIVAQHPIAQGDWPLSEPWGKYTPAIRRWEQVQGRLAPEPTVPSSGRPQVSPLFVEWLMGLDEGHVTKHVENRSAALRILGNGVVPQQAARAYAELLAAA